MKIPNYGLCKYSIPILVFPLYSPQAVSFALRYYKETQIGNLTNIQQISATQQ